MFFPLLSVTLGSEGDHMLIRRILQRAGDMCEPAYLVQKMTALTALVMLICAVICLISAEEWNASTYRILLLAWELLRTSASVLLIGIIGAVCIEDIHTNLS